MRNFLPVILVLLAILTAGCIAYVAWELSSNKPPGRDPGTADDADHLDDA